MSLGWQTESALMPSKSKPIMIDSKSMAGLKAIVEGGKKRLLESNNSNLSRPIKPLMSGKLIKAKKISDGSKEAKEKVIDEDAEIEEQRQQALLRKAKMYEALNTGEVSSDLVDCMVDFEGKMQQGSTVEGSVGAKRKL